MTLQGDLPDWSILEAPNVLFAGLFDQAFNTNVSILSFNAPFRVWAMWVSQVQTSNASYTGGGQSNRVRITAANNNNLLVTHTNISKASDHDNMALFLNFNGFTPPQNAGQWALSFVCDTGAANTFLHASCGVYYSIP